MDAHGHIQADEALMLDHSMEAPPIVRFDERRMHIRAYNYWASLLGDRSLPSIEDLNPSEIEDFGSHSVLLDFTSGIDDPHIAFLGSALAAQCDVAEAINRAHEIPARTLLSRLTDHYLQIIANAAPIGFEAEFTNQRGHEIMYRGIMMPFSTDDDTIDFVYGVINWKEVASDALSDSILAEVGASTFALPPLPDAAPGAGPEATPIWADRPSMLSLSPFDDEEDEDDVLDLATVPFAMPFEGELDELPGDDDFVLTPEMMAPGSIAPDLMAPDLMANADATLSDSLAEARDAAAAAHASEGRTRHALYRAIGLAHAFACAAAARPDDYAELLADSGIAVQERSPLTALAKLIFGVTYDKTRLTEFVCAIGHALETDMAPGALAEHLHAVPGGLKGVVAGVRAAKRGETIKAAPKASTRTIRKLAKAGAMDSDGMTFDETGLAVVVLRREADGSLAMVAALPSEDKLAAKVYSAAAKQL